MLLISFGVIKKNIMLVFAYCLTLASLSSAALIDHSAQHWTTLLNDYYANDKGLLLCNGEGRKDYSVIAIHTCFRCSFLEESHLKRLEGELGQSHSKHRRGQECTPLHRRWNELANSDRSRNFQVRISNCSLAQCLSFKSSTIWRRTWTHRRGQQAQHAKAGSPGTQQSEGFTFKQFLLNNTHSCRHIPLTFKRRTAPRPPPPYTPASRPGKAPWDLIAQWPLLGEEPKWARRG